MKRYKFLRSGLKSDSGNLTWKMGKWEKTKGELNICKNGLHCSKYPDQAFNYVPGEILAIVETQGKSIKEDDKECWEEMKIVKAYNWKKEDSVELAIYCAELVIGNYEKEYPNDNRPRKAIEAAKAWLKNPSESAGSAARSAAQSAESARSVAESARSVAESARSAESAQSARSAAWSARSAAWSAAWSARSAAWSAAWSARSAARSAAWSAESAAWSAESAAKKEIVKKIRAWMTKRISKLEVYEV